MKVGVHFAFGLSYFYLHACHMKLWLLTGQEGEAVTVYNAISLRLGDSDVAIDIYFL
jgi:hypothetical protein